MTDEIHVLGGKWLERIRSAEKREDQWIKRAESAEKAYLVDTQSDTGGEIPTFNILHSNVETIVPAIINSSPSPDVRPRHNAKDPGGKEISDTLERALSTQIDDAALIREIENVAQDGFLSGRGIVRAQLDADVAGDAVQNERLRFECVSWRDYREGPARRWSEVPWIAFAHYVSDEEIERLSDEDIPLPEGLEDAGTPTESDGETDTKIWEIWDKADREVWFITNTSGRVMSRKSDPLQLPEFFPVPMPFQPIGATGRREPVCPYAIYEEQAKELDRITKRINRILSGLRVRGIMAGNAESISRLADADDNELIAVEDLESLVAMGGIEKAITWWPIGEAITVLRELYVAREATKQTIYEITGISDIVRGASKTSETATAQQIKTQWGSLRIKRMQAAIQRMVRDVFVISAEIMWQHFQPQTLAKAAGVELTPELIAAMQQPLDHFRIDVESDSTVRADLTARKGEMAEFLQGTATFFQTMAPIVQQEPQSAVLLAEIYGSFARQFNLGKQAEDALDGLAEQAKEIAASKVEDPAKQMQQQAFQIDMEGKQLDMQAKQAELQLGAQKQQMDAQIKQAELQLKQADLMLKRQALGLEIDKAKADTMLKVGEMQLERAQQRPVLIG